MYRIEGGNDLIASRLAALLGDRLHLGSAAAAVRQGDTGVDVAVSANGRSEQIHADYLVLALPVPVLRDLVFDPPLPDPQREAVDALRFGRATRTLLQVDRRFWRTRGRPLAWGTDLEVGALWDGNEEQDAETGILSFLAGASASEDAKRLFAHAGARGFLEQVEWLDPAGTRVLHAHQIVWQDDPWARGGYAYFDPSFDPALRAWLARPFRRVVFCGEHTSSRWQGYMNGAVESGLRAAAEVRALHGLRRRDPR